MDWVSFKRLQKFVVKIGDFGLTRDVFENDYYRMTGSAPLPIRCVVWVWLL